MPRRNLVFIMSDQQRRDSMGSYGSEWAETPHLDALADSGYLFENAYVTQPVCTPARASIMTGLYPHTAGPTVNKIVMSPDIPVIAEMVSEEYFCGYMGQVAPGQRRDQATRVRRVEKHGGVPPRDLYAARTQGRALRLSPSPSCKRVRTRRRIRRRNDLLPQRQVAAA